MNSITYIRERVSVCVRERERQGYVGIFSFYFVLLFSVLYLQRMTKNLISIIFYFQLEEVHKVITRQTNGNVGLNRIQIFC